MLRRSLLTVAVALLGGAAPAVLAPADAAATHFANCTAMHKKYAHGVGKTTAHDHVTSGSPVTNFYRSNALYAANSGSDRDHDGVACEAR